MNFSSNISKRIIKVLEKLLQKTGLKKPSAYDYDHLQIISKAVIYKIPYNDLKELTELICEYEILLKEAYVNGISQNLSIYDPEGLKQKIKEHKEKLAAIKNLNMKDQICTPLELKIFALSEHCPSAFRFARFIESTSDKKYTVINRQFVFDALDAVKKQASFSDNLKEEFMKKWKTIIEML